MRDSITFLGLLALMPGIVACLGEEASPDPAATEQVTPMPETTAAATPVDNYVPAQQVADIPIERVEFATGSNSATIDGSITGYEIIDYVVKVAAGQPMKVTLTTQNTATYFNLIPPGETEVADFIGSTSGNAYEGVTEFAGDYRIRVYMMRSAARRDEKADYRLDIVVG